ncbi:hypothetical protein BDQ17DRAFT_180047 [Cyathus striatus]|nr:hypothetical protein BDQ17DRAFT_180047 [Cyathus striatus]
MASCYTWSTSTSHIRHPWFDNSIAKRKHSTPPSSGSSSPSPDIDSDDPDISYPPLKRRRCSTLENGIAHLTLNHPFGHVYTGLTNPGERRSSSPMPQVQEVVLDSPLPINLLHPVPDIPMDSNDGQQPTWPDVVLPSSVEEPPIPEIKMKSSSWMLELHRLFQDDTAPNPISINPAYLEHMRSQSLGSMDPSRLKTPSSQALVLFKPLPHALPSSEEQDDTIGKEMAKVSSEQQSTQLVCADDAMDVEP